MSDWGVCGWVFRVFRGFKVGYRVFYGFLGWMSECGGHRKGFEGYGVLLRGLIKGFSDSLCCFNDFSDSCQFYTETVILLKHCFFVIL